MKYRIYSRKAYLDNEGRKKVLFYKAGYIRVRDDGVMFMRLYGQPDTSFQIFKSEEEAEEAINNS